MASSPETLINSSSNPTKAAALIALSNLAPASEGTSGEDSGGDTAMYVSLGVFAGIIGIFFIASMILVVYFFKIRYREQMIILTTPVQPPVYDEELGGSGSRNGSLPTAIVVSPDDSLSFAFALEPAKSSQSIADSLEKGHSSELK